MIAHSLHQSTLLLAQTESAVPLEWRLRWNWNWPLWVTFLVIVTAVLWVMAIYFRETSTAGKGIRTLLGSLRLTALALALLMFAQPTLEYFWLGKQRLVLLLDRSSSMDALERYPGTKIEMSRRASWKKFLTEGDQPMLQKWQSDYQLDVLEFDNQIQQLVDSERSITEQIQPNPLARPLASASGTRLGDAIDYALRKLPGEPPVAIVALTDGISTRGQTLSKAAERARRMRVPLYTVAVGSDRQRPDIGVENLLVEEIVFPGDRLQVEATVRATGYEGKSVEAILRDSATASVLARTTLKLPPDEATQTLRLAIRPDVPGRLALELAIKPLDDETNTENNVAKAVVEVRDEKIRVLLVQAQPSYEYRALKSLLERDPAVELHVHLQEADAEYHSVDDTALRSFPATQTELFSYDVLLLGDVDLGLLPRSVWPLIERFVAVHGGGMVAIAGPQFMPIAFRDLRSMQVLLPMDLQSPNPLRSRIQTVPSQNGELETFLVTPTALGWHTPSLQLGETLAESQHIWSKLPPVSWIFRIDKLKPGAQVLAESRSSRGQRLPVILRHYVGAGEVLFHATEDTWRWRWRTDDRYFARYWGQVVRRLGRGRLAAGRQGVVLTADRSLYEPGEAVQLQARFRNPAHAPAENDQVLVELQGLVGPALQVTLRRRVGRRGFFTATVEDLAPSEYTAFIVRPSVDGSAGNTPFEVRQPPRELAQVAVNRQGLIEAAEISGGKSYTLATAQQLTSELPSCRQQRLDEMPPRSLWNSHAMMALFVIVLASEWLLRRRYGML